MRHEKSRKNISILMFTLLCSITILVLLQFTHTDSSKQDAITFALNNRYSIPTGIYAVCFLLVSGVFLLTFRFSRTSWALLLLMLSYATLMLYSISTLCGEYFLPESLYKIITWRWFVFLPSHSILLFILLNQDRYCLKRIFRITIVILLAQSFWYFVTKVTGGYFHIVIEHQFKQIYNNGTIDNTLLWYTLILLFSTTGATIYTSLTDLMNHQIKNSINQYCTAGNLDHYDAYQFYLQDMQEKYIRIQANWSRLSSQLKRGDYTSMESLLDTISQQFDTLPQPIYCNNKELNGLLLLYEYEARQDGILIEFDIDVTDDMPIPQEDVRFFLTNLLNNAIEANRHVDDTKSRKIRLELHYTKGCLSICCENTYQGKLLFDESGYLVSTKDHHQEQGFGLQQMTAIARKYGNSLAIHYDKTTFTIQTKLQIVSS